MPIRHPDPHGFSNRLRKQLDIERKIINLSPDQRRWLVTNGIKLSPGVKITLPDKLHGQALARKIPFEFEL